MAQGGSCPRLSRPLRIYSGSLFGFLVWHSSGQWYSPGNVCRLEEAQGKAHQGVLPTPAGIWTPPAKALRKEGLIFLVLALLIYCDISWVGSQDTTFSQAPQSLHPLTLTLPCPLFSSLLTAACWPLPANVGSFFPPQSWCPYWFLHPDFCTARSLPTGVCLVPSPPEGPTNTGPPTQLAPSSLCHCPVLVTS